MILSLCKKNLCLIVISQVIAIPLLAGLPATAFASSRYTPARFPHSKSYQVNNQYSSGNDGGINSNNYYYWGSNQGNDGNRGYNSGNNMDNSSNSGNQVINQDSFIENQVNTQKNNQYSSNNDNGFDSNNAYYYGYDQGNSGNRGYNLGNNQDNSSNSGNQVNNQGNFIDPSVKPWALALGIEASPLKADRVVGDIPLLTLSTFYTILEQVFWYRHN
ncbi:hypothetical protein [Ktedonobacter sp. SOSP1-85]|uniref:hypothetical protein n=1 Tax=Ktedonobacter sp. SOSP1-85 TaxID=2778367 RepID=UPI001916B0BE|nr:hypothetical protein [Ktedonobacter sp. SOSP1-85]